MTSAGDRESCSSANGGAAAEEAPAFVRKAFPRTWYSPPHKLLVWFPIGIFNEVFADQVFDYVEMEERIQDAPFNRFVDLSGLFDLRVDLNYVVKAARRRRRAKQPVKTAIYADTQLAFGIARMYEQLMDGGMIEVRAFNAVGPVAEWLEVPSELLKCPA